MKKRGQFQLSFGMIFSIILIIVFITVAFYVINVFLGIRDNVETGAFINDLDFEIERVWKSSGGEERVVNFNLRGSEITHICFYNAIQEQKGKYKEQYEDIANNVDYRDNFYFYPRRFAEIDSAEIEHINLNLPENPYCIENKEGGFSIEIKKDIRDELVTISRA